MVMQVSPQRTFASDFDRLMYDVNREKTSLGYRLYNPKTEYVMWITYNVVLRTWLLTVDAKIEVKSKDREDILRWMAIRIKDMSGIFGRPLNAYERMVIEDAIKAKVEV